MNCLSSDNGSVKEVDDFGHRLVCMEKKLNLTFIAFMYKQGLYNIQIGYLNSKKAGKNWHFYGSDVPKSTLDIFLA